MFGLSTPVFGATGSGWSQPIRKWSPPKNVFGLLIDRNFPADDATRLVGGVLVARPEALWVVRETDRRARRLLSQATVPGSSPWCLDVVDCVVLAPLVGYWKWGTKGSDDFFDRRAAIRDEEISRTCELVFVARDRRSDALDWWVKHAELFKHIKVATR